MRKGESIRDEISFNGADGQKSTDFIQAVRTKAFDENKTDDHVYMATLMSLCLTGLALEWFESLGDAVQTDWSQLRHAFLARFPASETDHEDPPSHTLTFSGISLKESEEFVRGIRNHSRAEGKSQDDQWTANYAASCMAGDALQWHAKLDTSVRNSWIELERAILAYFNEPPPYALAPAGRVLVERWECTQAPLFIPSSEKAWLEEARQRRAEYDKAGAGGLTSVHWVLVEAGRNFPESAIPTGVEPSGLHVFSARTWHEGGLHTGKIVQRDGSTALYIPFWGRELGLRQPYEVLVGDTSAVRWVSSPWTPEDARNAPPIQMKPFYAIEGGREKDGTTLLLAQAHRNDCGWQPGKVGPSWQGCEIGWCGEAKFVQNFRILVWAD